jgi:general secretion pathway protein B
MSFILDALKKSESDRQRQSSPALFEVKVAAPRRRLPVWVVAVGALLLVNVGVLLWVLLRDRAPTVATAPGPVNPSAITAPGTAPPGMVTVTIPSTQVNIPLNAMPANPPAPEPGVVAPSQAPPLVEEPLLSGLEPSVPPDYDTRDFQPAITPEQAATVAAARRAGEVPSRDEVLSQGTQLPDLRLDLHVYAVARAERFVFINMRKLREGDSLPEGIRVDEITPKGARLSYRGTQFALEGN